MADSGASESKKHVVTGEGVPKAIGPYSQGITASGHFVFVSGQAAVGDVPGKPVGATMREQAQQAFKNLDAVLRAAGSRPDLVVSVTAMLGDMSAFGEFNEVFQQFFPEEPPARMTFGVTLAPGYLLSVGCTALVA